VTHHYPEAHPEAAKHGQEEMANALAAAADIESTIDSGRYFGEARFRYADEVGVQLLPGSTIRAGWRGCAKRRWPWPIFSGSRERTHDRPRTI
jgi:hypothetical protein